MWIHWWGQVILRGLLQDHVMQKVRAIIGSGSPEPEQMVSTRWHADPFALGSYSHLPPGASPSDYDLVTEAVEGRLFFAGEGTSRKYPATVHGADLSGESAAAEIIDLVL
ncbi:MAG: hypothetical protein CME24_12785 [Gemmatimonadetes bacterium]|nr:hypothetical protein [Gemmatimonadota bacterium]